jgi:hypothetical protein
MNRYLLAILPVALRHSKPFVHDQFVTPILQLDKFPFERGLGIIFKFERTS